jgi:hypothetical protein
MEFLAESQAENERPDDAALQAWLDRNPGRYSSGTRFSFDQVYLGPIGQADGSAEGLLKKLRDGADWHVEGKAISLPRSTEAANSSEISRDFGDDFAASLADLPKGQWTGPVTSGFGLHLVRVRQAEASNVPPLSQVRHQVETDWLAATVKAREAAAYKLLFDRYTIKIARP